ncbi:MAG TPA: fibronectin type III domain-containing protein, partial [Candidatus Krumholzibacteria bacterium]|nr:fibronectin type III domain-containing protein [Candidatus Krumholzibacteria bacterium]
MKSNRIATAAALSLTLLWVGCGNDDNPPVAVDSAAPAKVTDLAIADAGENSITLTWTAPGDDGTRGT